MLVDMIFFIRPWWGHDFFSSANWSKMCCKVW
jgi:hypothetical protein